MAEKTVRVSVLVSDDGTMRLTEKSAKKLQGSLQGVGASAATADRSLKGAAQASSNTTKNFSKMAQGITGGLVPAYATLAANVFAVTALFRFLQEAGDLRALQEGQVAYASTTGVALGVLTEDIRKAASGLLTFKDAAQAAAIGVASGLQGSQLEQLAEGAANVSKILGRDVTDSFNRLVRGVTKAEPELLDELGITLKLAKAKEDYATALNKTANALTLAEQKQAVFLAVSTQLEEKYNRINELLAPENNSFTELAVAFDDALKVVKSFTEAIATPIAKFFTGNINSLIAALGLFAIPIIKSIIPSLENWREVTAESTARVVEDIEEAQTKINEITAKRAEIAPGSPQEVAQGIVGKVKARRGSGLQALQEQKRLSERQIKGIIRSLENKTKTFENLSDKEKIVLKKNLELMLADAKKANIGIVQTFKNTFTRLGLGFNQMAKQAEIAFLRVKAAAIEVTGFLTKWAGRLLSIASGIGLITLAAEGVKTALRAAFGAEADASVQKYIKSLDELAERQESINDEYEKFVKIQLALLENNTLNAEAFLAFSRVLDTTTGKFKELRDIIAESNQAQIELEKSTSAVAVGGIPRATEAIIKFVTSFLDLNGEVEKNEAILAAGLKAQQEYARSALLLVDSLDGLGLVISDDIQRFRDLNVQLAAGKPLTEDQVKEYDALVLSVGNLSREFGGLVAARAATDEQVSKSVNSITQFTTKNKDLIDSLEKRLVVEERLLATLTKAEDKTAQARIVQQLRADLELQNRLRKQEIQLTLKKKSNEVAALKASRGAFNFEKKRAKLAKSINDIKAEEADVFNKFLIATSAGVKRDEKRIQQLRLQLSLLEQQRLALEDQTMATKKLEEAVKSTLESSLSTNLADLIKNNEGSLKDAVAKLAKSVFESIADVLAQDMTEKILEGIGLFQSPAKKMYEAFQAGGDYVKRKIQEGFGTDTSGTAVPTASGPPDPTGAAPEGTQKAGFFEKLFGRRVTVSSEIEELDKEGNVTGVTEGPDRARRAGGIFGPFLNSFSDIFDKNTEGGFLQKLGTSFGDLLGGFGGLFKQLPSLLGSLFGGIGGGFGSLFGGIFGFASGGIMYGGMKGFANGGIVNKPTMGMIGEGGMNEAVVPLPDGKSIPVTGVGGSQENNISISVNMSSDGSSQERVVTNDQEGANLGRAISAAVQAELQRQKRPGGILSPYGAA